MNIHCFLVANPETHKGKKVLTVVKLNRRSMLLDKMLLGKISPDQIFLTQPISCHFELTLETATLYAFYDFELISDDGSHGSGPIIIL